MLSNLVEQGPNKKKAPQARKSPTAAQHFLPCGAACCVCGIHLVRHDIIILAWGKAGLAYAVDHLSTSSNVTEQGRIGFEVECSAKQAGKCPETSGGQCPSPYKVTSFCLSVRFIQ